MLSRPENGCIHAQAPRIAEPKHSQQVDRVRGDDVLAKEHCTSVIVGYGVKMKRRLCVSVQCALFTSLSRIYLSRIVEKVPKNLSSYAPDQDEGNKQQCN